MKIGLSKSGPPLASILSAYIFKLNSLFFTNPAIECYLNDKISSFIMLQIYEQDRIKLKFLHGNSNSSSSSAH